MKKLNFLICVFTLGICFGSFAENSNSISNSTFKMEKIATIKTGKQPKQVGFSPDGKFLVFPLLEENGFRVVEIKNPSNSKFYSPNNTKQDGFAEVLFLPSKNSFFVSQMTTGFVHEYSYPGFEFKRSVKSNGVYPKFMAFCKELNILAVSNWVSNEVSLIDYNTGTVLRKIKTGKCPRGLLFLNGGKEILVMCFEGGKIQKFSTNDGKLLKEFSKSDSAMRHVVLSADEKICFVSDMYYACVYEFDVETFTIVNKYKVFNNPNTICLLGDKLFVSCRGPNNKEDYTKPSPVDGKLYVFNTTSKKLIKVVQGGNQPTGLDISPDGKYLCSTNFQDANCDLYLIGE